MYTSPAYTTFSPCQEVDDGLQGSNPNFIVVGNWDGDGAYWRFFLHDDMASAAAHFFETMSRQNCAHLFTGKNFKPNQQPPQPA
jgi:hypothetical protein